MVTTAFREMYENGRGKTWDGRKTQASLFSNGSKSWFKFGDMDVLRNDNKGFVYAMGTEERRDRKDTADEFLQGSDFVDGWIKVANRNYRKNIEQTQQLK